MSIPLPAFLGPLLEAPVAILGSGMSGAALVELVSRIGGQPLVYDERPGMGHSQVFDEEVAERHRLVLFSPGFPLEHPWLVVARRSGCTMLGELDFASLLWRGRSIAITGTNGKTTLTEFITHALRHIGSKAYSTGNVGFPFSRLVAENEGGRSDLIAVCEVSSFQAESFEYFRADAALWTNFAEDHLERHLSLRSYFLAKYEVVRRVPATRAFTGTSVTAFAQQLGISLPVGSAVRSLGLPSDAGLADTVFANYPQRENFELARVWWLAEGLPLERLYSAAASFRLGRHRLGLVREVGGVRWWNDSKATNFHAVEGALARFERPVFLIAGGKSKGGDIAGFALRIASRLAGAFLIGETRELLAEAFAKAALPYRICVSLEEAVALASEQARPGDQVLLSPGFASFDMFRGYDHRGEVFESLVQALPE